MNTPIPPLLSPLPWELLSCHPPPGSRAPQLLAALLGRGGVAPQLLPLLAEPATRALRGLSATARRARPQAAAPFLQANHLSRGFPSTLGLLSFPALSASLPIVSQFSC